MDDPTRGKDRSWIVAVAVLLLTVIMMLLGSTWKNEAYQEFPGYRAELRTQGLAVVSISEDAYANLFQVVDSEGKDVVTKRSVDALVFKVPESGNVILKTMNCLFCPVGSETYASIRTSVVAGNFLGPRGEKMNTAHAKNLYADYLRPKSALGIAIENLLHAIFYPTSPGEDE